MSDLHVSQARKILDSGSLCDIEFFKRNGELVAMSGVVSLKSDLRSGVRNIKSIESRQIRKIRDVLLFKLNGCNVYL